MKQKTYLHNIQKQKMTISDNNNNNNNCKPDVIHSNNNNIYGRFTPRLSIPVVSSRRTCVTDTSKRKYI